MDVSFAYPLSNVGFNAGDPGGVDAGFGYAFDRTHRLQVGYYEIQQVPINFSNENVPFYLQGFTGPGSNVPGASLGTVNTGVVDATTKDKIFQVGLQNLFVLGGKLPIVITPTYLAHTATIGGHTDLQLVEYNGFPTTVRLRTEQEWLLGVTLPFLATPRMFGTFTVGAAVAAAPLRPEPDQPRAALHARLSGVPREQGDDVLPAAVAAGPVQPRRSLS